MSTRRGMWMILGGVLAATIVGCGAKDDRKPTFAVAGKVVEGGKPVANATIVFHPIDDPDPNAVRPRGQTAADGSFQLTTYLGSDGAPAGQYRVTVELWLAGGKGDEAPTSRLNRKFANPLQSGLTASVGTGPTELQPFAVSK
jgi:hypothetical protein